MSRNSVLVLPMSIVVSKHIEDIFLIRDFLIFSREVPEDCFITARPSSLYKPIFNGPVIGDISLSLYNPIRSQTSAPWNEPIAIPKLLMLDFFVQILLSYDIIVCMLVIVCMLAII